MIMMSGDSSTRNPPLARAPAIPHYRDIFSTPAPLRSLFAKVPLITYDANHLPARAPTGRSKHTLYVFSTPDDSAKGRPSFNPRCLKWQVYLRFCGIEHQLQPSTNHASPSGILPFLLPASASSSKLNENPVPLPSGKLQRWAASINSSTLDVPADPRFEAYVAPLDSGGAIRKAWLYFLYLSPPNTNLVHRLYISPHSNNSFVQIASLRQLRQAALAEVNNSITAWYRPAPIDVEELLSACRDAFQSLSSLLGDHEWFFGEERPGLFDATVFSYTQSLLDENLGGFHGWKDHRLCALLEEFTNLVKHRNNILKGWFSV
ncbi:MAG: hypothetical protein M1814_002683 [Vezdaea aestivalis]|nr:MAG: hypothetical protein M1814_002683 [Vezdaea aestivalis]